MFYICKDLNYTYMTYNEIIYMIMDELKLSSKDSYFTEDHIIFLATKYRNMLVRQRYTDIRKDIPLANYQTIRLELTEVPAIAGIPCEGGSYLKSTVKIPLILNIITPRIYAADYFQGELTYVSMDRLRYVGDSKYTRNIVYCTIGPDHYLYFKSSNPQFLYLAQVNLFGLFEDIRTAATLDPSGSITDYSVLTFPLDDSVVPTLVQLVAKELSAPEYAPKDDTNDDNDDLDNTSPNQNYVNALRQQAKSNNNQNEE